MVDVSSRPARRLLRAAALLHPLLRPVPGPLRLGVASRVAVSREHRFIYFRVPKAANSTVARTLAAHAFPERREVLLADPTGRGAKQAFDGLPRAGALTVGGLKKRYVLLSFFRDPYARVLSAYLDKLRSGNRGRFGWVAQRAGVGSVSELTFGDFVDFLEGGGLVANAHWAPQTVLCPVPVVELDFRGRVEHLETDLQAVVERIFGVGAWRGTDERLHNRQYAGARLAEYYTPELAARVYELYRGDFVELGYSRELGERLG